MLLVRILAFIQQSPNPSSAIATIKQFCHRTMNEDEEILHKLLGEQFGDQLNMLRELTANVVNGDSVQEVIQSIHNENSCLIQKSVGFPIHSIKKGPYTILRLLCPSVCMSLVCYCCCYIKRCYKTEQKKLWVSHTSNQFVCFFLVNIDNSNM